MDDVQQRVNSRQFINPSFPNHKAWGSPSELRDEYYIFILTTIFQIRYMAASDVL